ncbi:hypothetical protein [Christiangramia forsetii]|uniref:Uncharacterized protein n=2 Tax=Christiangramia forsetii TaxID=411153 RepID=A0M459_CHRFK|nr:hypothetical protein [Christiangramia forsetii]GGG24173.1 hypothetical protein GCM10011532_04260 [Christiangramia forsetii]CAL67404.1 hypothetical protein GFO_2448 [Christiangramia forsetii KT0803]
MITKKHKTPLYGTEFTIVVYNNNKEFEDKFKDWEFDQNIESFDGAVFKRKEMYYIVFSAEKKGYPTPGIIAHESKHLVNNIFIDICHNLDLYNDEPEAYLLGWIVNRVHEVLNKVNN